MEQFFDYEQFKMLRKVEDINALYTFGRVIGQGTYGQVREAVHI